MQLSKRLQTVADMVSAGKRLADVGTDHAYVPIYLVENGRIPCAIALDINRGPLSRAKEHIAEHQLLSYIDTRLSDGVHALKMGEADSLIIAGMGGGLILKILKEGEEVVSSFEEWILQPQSEIESVRQYLDENHFAIIEEDIVFEEGKYYPMMKVAVQYKQKMDKYWTREKNDIYYKYGKLLLESKNPILEKFLKKEYQQYKNLIEKLSISTEEHIVERTKELELELSRIKGALQFYESKPIN